MAVDEVRALEGLRAARGVFKRLIEQHGGRIANTAGDGLIADFPSVVEAVQCAIDVQNELRERSHAREDVLRFRIGIHLGDVIIDGDDLLGDGVNLAARLQTMAEPDGILVSRQVYEQVQNKLTVGFDYLGEKRPRNFRHDVGIYRVAIGESAFQRWLGGMRRGVAERSHHEPVHDEPVHDEWRHHDRGDAEPPAVAPDGLRERVTRHAKLLGTIWVALTVVDVVTGDPFWAHWPGLAMLTLLALEAAPLWAGRGLNVHMARGAAIIGLLVLINIITWSGYPWALWPAGALLIAELLRRTATRSH
jgi:adenylate cyclase